MKIHALLSLALLGCGLPAPPPSTNGPNTSADASPEPSDGDDEGGDGGDEGEEPGPDAAPAADAQPNLERLTQSTSHDIAPGLVIDCADDQSYNYEYSFYRLYDLPTLGINREIHVSKVEVGVLTAISIDGTQTVEAKLHAVNGDMDDQDFTTLATAQLTLENMDDPDRVQFDFDATVAAGTRLAVEIHVPDGDAGLDYFVIGGNSGGQTAAPYMKMPECADEGNRPRNMVDFYDGLQNAHILIDVLYR